MSARWQHIRDLAADARERYATLQGGKLPLQLPLADLGDELYRLSVYDDHELGPEVNGELNAYQRTIRLRPGMAPTFRNFVIAHELGHYVLEGRSRTLYQDDATTLDERADGDPQNDAGVLRSYNTRERHEQEASLFGLELLLPAEHLWQQAQMPGWSVQELAAQYGVSCDALQTQLINVCCLQPVRQRPPTKPLGAVGGLLDPHQQAAVDAPLPTLVNAGPGTGKTRCIVAKYEALINAGVAPRQILALTFSNKAAEEMRERVIAALGHSHAALVGQVEISTFHAWGLNLLRTYGHRLALPAEVQLRGTADLFILLKRRLAELPLHQYKALYDPGHYLPHIIRAISRAKDELLSPADYRAMVERQTPAWIEAAEAAQRAKPTVKKYREAYEHTVRDAARLRELADIYAAYERILRDEGVLDYGDLIKRAVEVLSIPAVASDIHQQYAYILVDEFQDINYASGQLVALLDGGRDRVWAVGDPWQSIYRFRGASPANIAQFAQVYPRASQYDLRVNFRSIQPILDASHAVMKQDLLWVRRPALHASRPAPAGTRVVEWVAASPQAEAHAIVADILRRVRGPGYRSSPPDAKPQRRQGARNTLRLGAFASHGRLSRRARFGDHAILCRTHSQAAVIVAALEARHVPVDWVGDILDAPEVKDALAVCALTESSNSAGMLRLLTVPQHELPAADFLRLVRLAHENQRMLNRAVRDPIIVGQLSAEAQGRLYALEQMLASLEAHGDVWQLLTAYLFGHSEAMRQHIIAAAAGGYAAQRALATLGQLLVLARGFVRQTPKPLATPASFIAYVRLLLEAGEGRTAPPLPAHIDAVRVMTVHSAKGLEFPIVYVPGLHANQFPLRRQGSSIPDLPALRHAQPGSDPDDELYLLYVAMTRARDRLILSRAAYVREKPVKRSRLLPDEGQTLPWPIRQAPTDHVQRPRPNLHRLDTAAITRSPIPASSLETYDRCGRRFLYQYGFQLYDDATSYLRMHQTIRDVVKTLTQRAAHGALPGDESALDNLVRQVFTTHELPGVLYEQDYYDEAFRHVRAVWEDLRGGGRAPADLDRTVVVSRPQGQVLVRIDRVEQHGRRPRWVRLRSGKEAEGDQKALQTRLYALAYHDTHGGPVQIALHYTATGTRQAVEFAPEALEEIRAELDTLLAALAAGAWNPAPGPQCATCAFTLICPV